MPSKSILVVEDETLIRMSVAAALRAAGWDVTEARNGDDALAILDAGRTFAVIFTDIQMPGSLSGIELAAIARRRCAAAIAIGTAYDPPGVREGDECDLLFQKPYDLDKVILRLLGVPTAPEEPEDTSQPA